MEETNSNIEENEIKTKLFATPVAKLMEAQKRAEKFAEEKEAHNTCKELVKCVALTRIIYGNGHWRLAQAFANLAHSYLMLQGLPVQAKKHANSAKYSIFMRKSSPLASTEEREIQSTLVTIYYTLGVANLMQKNGKESYCNLQKAERIMEELQGTETTGFRVSERDLMAALGRASLQNNKLELAARYFEKAIEATISSGGETAPELISLYQEMAEMEQIKKNHEKAIRCLLQRLLKNISLRASQSTKRHLAWIIFRQLMLWKTTVNGLHEQGKESKPIAFSKSHLNRSKIPAEILMNRQLRDCILWDASVWQRRK
ncbi:tetratricopeptide repeat protein 23-like isoform X5 [Sceloporus undulatus]|uniref:tetratricopeptide repeat protein 23-like isoform X5 n=1 Tax=Sceloporus undulatus TaxID=8520 RepID=UPI001C4C119B|nr:tetratricopeptide repeat protein 23-like isoform X5 [Sceloporus undulatus]